jgi:hypothetical protein
MPVSSEIRPWVTPCAFRIVMIVPRSRLAHASSMSGSAKTRSTISRTSEIAKATARSRPLVARQQPGDTPQAAGTHKETSATAGRFISGVTIFQAAQ